jgi:DtxR family Mn-dependent transcriptional regulator
MVDPALALAVFGAIVLLLSGIFWPRLGLVPRLRRLSHLSERVLLEDALKHVYMRERVGAECSPESVAGRLEVTVARATDLLSKLAESGLVRNEERGPRLTDAGRESAVRLVRTHRLWERYLADRTGVPAGEWHAQAERMEHALSETEVHELSARLGHPAWDPHGDPIPTAGGELPAARDLSLAGARPGTTVEVVHLEDEPEEIYDALRQDGFDLGARIDVVDRSDNAVTVHARGRDWTLDNVVARNVTVHELPAGAAADAPVRTLADLEPGSAARVVGLSPACQGSQRRRLLDLGVVRGTEIEAVLRSAAGDPIAYRIRGALIALRREQAHWIRIDQGGASAPTPEEEPARPTAEGVAS